MSNSQNTQNQKKQSTSEYQTKMNKVQQLLPPLVKYDTPYLVSTTVKAKKSQEEELINEQKIKSLLAYVFDLKTEKSKETEEYSVKDALNIILPPVKERKEDQLWVRFVSCNPVTKSEVTDLKTGLSKNLAALKAKETGICTVREKLYSECFDELIRQVTINCLERGILMKLVKIEYENQMKTYQNLYQSSIAYGVRKYLMANQEKEQVDQEIKKIEEECQIYKDEIKKLELEIEETAKKDELERKELSENHKADCTFRVGQIKGLKMDIKKVFLELNKAEKFKNQ